MESVRLDFLVWLVLICSVMLGLATVVRALVARHGSGLLAQRRFRRLYGIEITHRLGGRLDPRPGSPWIDTYLDGRPVQLLAAPLDEGLQTGVLLLDHSIPVNVWHTSGDDDELEAPTSVNRSRLDQIVQKLAAVRVDSVTCGCPLDEQPRPPHLLRMHFTGIDDLVERLDRVAPLLVELEELAP